MKDSNRDNRQTVYEGVIECYLELLAMMPGPNERRKQIIEKIVSEFDAQYGQAMCKKIRWKANLGYEDAEDLWQEILLKWARQLEKGHKLPAPEALTKWVSAVVGNAAVDCWRRLKRSRRLEEEFANHLRIEQQRELAKQLRSSDDPVQDDELTAIEAALALDATFRRLLKQHNATERMLLVYSMRSVGRTLPEIADELGVCVKTVWSNLEKVRNILRVE
jgi:RNA polymerase sigma factor (sigma-70 family)